MIRVDGNQVPWKEGITISILLNEIIESGKYAVVRLNGRTVSRPNFETTHIPDDSEVILIPMIAGG